MNFNTVCLAAAWLAVAAAPAHAEIVTLNSSVALTGSGFGISNGWGGSLLALPSSVTDGVFLPTSQQWNTNTVFWGGGVPDNNDFITITLAQAALIDSLHLQGDVNDLYAVSYMDLEGGWRNLATIAPNTNTSWGLGDGYASFAPVSARALRINAVGGDGSYSVAELQANGSALAVPEPATLLLALGGIGAALLPLARRRRAKLAQGSRP